MSDFFDIKLESQGGDKDPLKSLAVNAKAAAKQIGDARVPLKASAMVLIASVDKNIKSQGRPEKWQKHSPISALLRANPPKKQAPGSKGRKLKKPGTKDQLLQNDALLKNGIEFRVSDDEASVFPTASYAIFQQRGVKRHPMSPNQRKYLMSVINQGVRQGLLPKKKVNKGGTVGIPERPFMMIQEEDLKDIDGIFGRHIEKAANRMAK